MIWNQMHLCSSAFPSYMGGGVQPLSCVQLFATQPSHRCQAPLSSTTSWYLLKFMSIELVMLSNHLILCLPFSFCLRSFPPSGSFLMSQFFASDGQSIGASATVLPKTLSKQRQIPISKTVVRIAWKIQDGCVSECGSQSWRNLNLSSSLISSWP